MGSTMAYQRFGKKERSRSAKMPDEQTLSPLEMEAPEETKPLDAEDPPCHSNVHVRKTIGVVQLGIIIFYSVSGGPFGIEESVRSAGPLLCLIGFLIGPFVFSIPEAALTAELGAAYPDASGGAVWVEEAFGPRASWTYGFLSIVSGSADSAIYPILFLDYFLQIVRSEEPHPWLQYAMTSVFAIALSYVTYRGLSVVGSVITIICLLSMSPFVVAILLGVWQVQPKLWFRLPNDSFSAIKWRPFVNNLFWNLNGFDAAANFSAEVNDPGRSFPRAMLVSVFFVACSYFLPLLIVLGVSDAPHTAWVDGYLATAISDVGGKWLENWLVFAAGITNVALFQAEMAADAYQVMGIAEHGYLPKFFSRRSRYGTPTYGILLGLIIVLIMGATDLESIIEKLNFAYAISLLMEYAAFLKLRTSKPEVHRPYRIPLSTLGCFIAMSPTIVAILFVMGLASVNTILFGFATVALALIIFHLRESDCVRHPFRVRPSYHTTEDAHTHCSSALELGDVVCIK